MTLSAWYDGIAEGAGVAWAADVDGGGVLLRLQGGGSEVEVGSITAEGKLDDIGGAWYVFTLNAMSMDASSKHIKRREER